jgi:hypothetical protein
MISGENNQWKNSFFRKDLGSVGWWKLDDLFLEFRPNVQYKS